MNDNNKEKIKNPAKGKNRPSKKTIVIIAITVFALLVQVFLLGKPHYFIIPPGLDCNMITTQKSLEDGSSLIIDSQGKRMFFTNEDEKLINVVETQNPESNISKVLEISTEDNSYYVHGVKNINGGVYISSESILEYDKNGNFVKEAHHVDYGENDFVTSVNQIYGGLNDALFINNQDATMYLEFSFQFFLINLLFYLSILWLAFVLIYLAIWFVRKKLNNKTKIICTIAIFMFTVICFYTANNCYQIQQSYEENVVVASKQIKASLETQKSIDQLQAISAEGLETYLSSPENQKMYDSFSTLLKEICNSYGKEQSIFVTLISGSSNDKASIIFDSRNSAFTGRQISFSDDQKMDFANSDINSTTQYSLPCLDAVYDLCTIKDSAGNDVAYLSVGTNSDNILSAQITVSLEILITLLALLIGVYVAISALIMCKDSILKCIKQKTSDVSERIVNLSGVYTLVYKFAYSIDSVLVVYIASSLCQGMDTAQQATFIAIPIALFYAGQWIGTFFATPLLKVFGERNVALISSIASIFVMLFLAWSVIVGDIYLYSIGRGLMGFVVSGLLYVVSGTLPICAKTKEQRTNAIESSMRGSIAAAIITTLIGGYASELAGYPIVYCIGAAMCGLLFVLTIITFGRKNKISGSNNPENGEDKNSKSSLKDCWLVFLRPEFLMYIVFFSIPDLLVCGYSSYVFPLIASGTGVSVILLSNLGVFSLALMYVCQKPIDRFSKNFSTMFLLVAPSVAICLGLIGFLISPSIYWAIILYFLAGVLSYMTNVSEKSYIIDTSEKYDKNPTLVQSNYYSIYSALQTGSTPALSAFMSLGVYTGCVALGVVCGAMFSIFGLFCKKD